jgi:hypothetical protein
MRYAAVLKAMSAQARDGAGRGDLEQIAEAALEVWPSAAGPVVSRVREPSDHLGVGEEGDAREAGVA